MTNVSNNALIMAPALNLVDSKKGSMGNRTECMLKQEKEHAKDVVQIGAGVGATAYGYNKINKTMRGRSYEWNTKINNYLKKGTKELKDEIIRKTHSPFVSDALQSTNNGRIILDKTHAYYKNLSFREKLIANVSSKVINGTLDVAEKLSKTSGRQKVLGAFIGVAAAGLLFLAQKQGFKRGQIDQQYNDRANAQKIVSQ